MHGRRFRDEWQTAWRERLHSSRVVQGAHATLASGITGNLQAASEREGRLGIDGLFQRELTGISDGWMEEAGANTAIHFDYGRDPRCVADWSLRRRTFDAFPKARSNPPQLGGTFCNEALVDVFLVPLDQELNLFFQLDQFGSVKRDFVLAFPGPTLFTVESCRRDIRSQEGDAVESKGSGGGDGGAKMCVVQLLHRRPAGYRYPRPAPSHLQHALLNSLKGPGDTTNSIMDLRRAIDRDNDVVEARLNDICFLVQQESCCE